MLLPPFSSGPAPRPSAPALRFPVRASSAETKARPGQVTLHPTTPDPVARGKAPLVPLRRNLPRRCDTWPPALSAARISLPARHLRSRWSSSFSFPYLVLPRAKRRVLLCVFRRQCHVEPRAAPLPHGALPIHLAAELGHPSTHNRQTQSCSLRLCRQQRLQALF